LLQQRRGAGLESEWKPTTPATPPPGQGISETMSNTYILPVSLHRMVSDASYSLSHVTTEGWLIALVVTAASIYFLNRAKAALIIAISGAIYLLPMLMTGKM
jgi:hypothetical protein